MLRSVHSMPTTITSDHAQAAATLVAACHPDRPDILKAAHKAADLLPVVTWHLDGGVLRVSSKSRPGLVHFSDGDHCDCEARVFCWHRAAWLLVQAVQAVSTMPEPRVRAARPTLETVQAEIDSWF